MTMMNFGKNYLVTSTPLTLIKNGFMMRPSHRSDDEFEQLDGGKSKRNEKACKNSNDWWR